MLLSEQAVCKVKKKKAFWRGERRGMSEPATLFHSNWPLLACEDVGTGWSFGSASVVRPEVQAMNVMQWLYIHVCIRI